METETVQLYVPDRLLERVDDACEASEYADRSEYVSAAIDRASDGDD